jgi:hypothetical protein
MRYTLANGAFGLASAAWSWFIPARDAIEETARFVGVIAGSAAAVLSVMIAIRTWRNKPRRK